MRSGDEKKKGGGWIVGLALIGGAAALAVMREQGSSPEARGAPGDDDLLAHWDAEVDGILRALRAERPYASEEEIQRLAMAPAGPIERLTRDLQRR
jgi:hypothetical protein